MLFLFTGWGNASGFNKIRIEIVHYYEVILKTTDARQVMEFFF